MSRWRQNFLTCDREQELLLPPSLREWLPEDHLAWFVIDAVDALDLRAFYADYREDGWGRAAHEPSMMVALLLYAYAIGERSSRAIERRCAEDIAFRVICANATWSCPAPTDTVVFPHLRGHGFLESRRHRLTGLVEDLVLDRGVHPES